MVQDGDVIELDVASAILNLKISDEELMARKKKWTPKASEHMRGWPALYQTHVLQPDEGCDFDFLRAPTEEVRRFVPPTVGRS